MIQPEDVYTIEWYIPKRVLLLQYSGDKMPREKLEEIASKLEELYQEGDAPIHIISDNTNQGDLDIDLSGIKQVFSVMKQPDWGWIFLIGTDKIISFFAVMVSHAFKLKIRNAESIEKALATLKRLDPTLD